MPQHTPIATTTVFASGKDGYPCCRIPSLVTTQAGTLLAFCEGRQTRHDHAQNNIVVKRSEDGGQSWSSAQVVADEGADSLNDPSVVVDRRNGRIVLYYSRFAEGFHTDKAVPGYDKPGSSRNYVVFSDDDGKSWSPPRDVTRQVKREDWRAAVVTCGIGIQLRRAPYAGRLVHAVYQFGGPSGREAYVVFSDDGGMSWTMGNVAPAPDQGRAAEPQVVELEDGRLMLNARTSTKRRKVALSNDGGATFSELQPDETLIEPGCQASILRYSDPLDGEPSRLLFSNPANENARDTGTVRLSADEGATWSAAKAIEPDSFAYSCLAVLPDKSIGCLYETNGYDAIVLARFTLDWLQS